MLRFLMRFAAKGGSNFGATGVNEPDAWVLHDAKLVALWDKTPFNPRVRTPRRFRALTAGEQTQAYVAHLREALRRRNLAQIAGLDDGHGAVAFDQDWRARRAAVIEAAHDALERWLSA